MLGFILSTMAGLMFFILMTLFYLPIVLILGDRVDPLAARKKFRYFGKWILGSIGTRVEVIYENREAIEKIDRNEGVVIVGNHQSNMDIPLILAHYPTDVGFVAKKEMETWPFYSIWMKRCHCVFLDRSNPREGIKSIRKAVEVIKTGYPTVIFPEGERTHTGEIGEFKKGSFKLATETKGIIVPLTIKGTYDLQSRGSINTKMFQKVKLIIGKPVDVKDMEVSEIKNLNKTIKEVIEENYRRY